jgi:hypothetical protein
MKIGDEVEKIEGYKWPGVVVSVFHKLDGQVRIVVETTSKDVEGALHIFKPDQFVAIHPAEGARHDDD